MANLHTRKHGYLDQQEQRRKPEGELVCNAPMLPHRLPGAQVILQEEELKHNDEVNKKQCYCQKYK
jgi:hypothetical protein